MTICQPSLPVQSMMNTQLLTDPDMVRLAFSTRWVMWTTVSSTVAMAAWMKLAYITGRFSLSKPTWRCRITKQTIQGILQLGLKISHRCFKVVAYVGPQPLTEKYAIMFSDLSIKPKTVKRMKWSYHINQNLHPGNLNAYKTRSLMAWPAYVRRFVALMTPGDCINLLSISSF